MASEERHRSTTRRASCCPKLKDNRRSQQSSRLHVRLQPTQRHITACEDRRQVGIQPSSVAPQPAALRQSANRTWPFAYVPARKSHVEREVEYERGWGGSTQTGRFPKGKRVFGKSITKIKAHITTLWSFRMESCSFTTCVRVSTSPSCNCRLLRGPQTRKRSEHQVRSFPDAPACH